MCMSHCVVNFGHLPCKVVSELEFEELEMWQLICHLARGYVGRYRVQCCSSSYLHGAVTLWICHQQMSSRLLNPLLYIFPFPSFQTLSTNSSTDSRAFPYDQPPAAELLVLLSFLFLLNVLREVADYFIHAGIIAEICLGMVYGAPLAGILPAEWEGAFTVLGYLGLIGIVFEGKCTLCS